jgi:hydrogenase maturation factor
MEIADKGLFLKYALPCASVLVKRGWVSQKKIDELREAAVKGRNTEPDVKDIFVVAYSMCSLIAKKRDKKGIDADVIRSYFWEEHDDVVDERFRQFRDFSPKNCRVYPGKVLETGRGVKVRTPAGVRTFRNVYKLDLSPGDYVTLHYDFVIEKIGEKEAEKLWRRKKPFVDGFVGFG